MVRIGSGLLAKIRHVPLKEDPKFEDAYVNQMRFPDLIQGD